MSNKHETAAEEFYATKVKGRKVIYGVGTEAEKIGPLIPKHITGLKAAMVAASKTNQPLGAAATAYLRSQGMKIAPAAGAAPAKAEPVATKSKPVKAETPVEETPEQAATVEPVEPEMPIQPVKNLDGKILGQTIATLQKAGIATGYKKGDAPEVLREKIIAAMDGMRNIGAVLGRFDAEKLTQLTGRPDPCIEIMTDLRDAACAACPTQAACTKGLIGHLADDFAAFKAAEVRLATAEDAEAIREEHVAVVTKAKKAPPAPPKAVTSGFDAKRVVQISAKYTDPDVLTATLDTISGMEDADKDLVKAIFANTITVELNGKKYRGHNLGSIKKLMLSTYGDLTDPDQATWDMVEFLSGMGDLKLLRLV